MEDYFFVRYFDVENNEKVDKPLEEVVKILLPSQINIDFHVEALKAQAIILRTNIIRKSIKLGGKGCDKHEGVDFCRSSHCYSFSYLEDYKDLWKDKYDENIKKIETAVKETEGLALTFNGKPILAEYHETCGGSTQNSENVIKSNVVYLRKVLCENCKYSANWESYKDFNLEDLEKIFNTTFSKEALSDKGQIEGFLEGIERDENGRVLSIDVNGEKYEGNFIVEKLKLNSNKFSIHPLTIRFITRGKGHGLGFCQYGGNQMAKEGKSFNDILEYYYTGIKIDKYPLPCIKYPLYGKIIVIDPGHGGKDFGHVGNLGFKEKDITLNISKEIKEVLENYGAKVYLTREKDEEVLLIKRAEITNNIKPDFFLSFHMDYTANSEGKGCKIYYYRKDEESKKLGTIFLDNLEKKLSVVNKNIREGNFYLLKYINVSSLIIEIGYLSNIEEEKRYMDEEYIKKLANVICESFLEYYEYYFLCS
ncbi:N-acetylmuramoyl-L-alanine amidase [Sporanaerobacter sp. PP17-6a]|uniref:N-acetylmuramoyl-L-alanine amidase n=1 Tax=Sporanaerobacter sp. PP17-6a TaxID=1891289 RepID=UPI00089F9478|nr:N-acetylmuramoyl-L-alanine amidase [Sporanaerobacter sp. PP17-6a]SCL86901.1 N-acetylmuramoyl-L-alanine amidase AmiA precursor [Sporanaerobacter sp. PP17-6a]